MGFNDECNQSAIQDTTEALFDQLKSAGKFENLNDIQRAGIYLLCRELSGVCHGEIPHGFQNLAYILGSADADDFKKTMMECMK